MTQPDNPADRLIYNALLALGHDDKALTASVIKKYDALLDAPEVLRRTGANADPETRAREVEQILRNYVGGIADERRKLVTQAALCTEKQYVGLRIGQRQELLAKSHCIGIDTFKYHRKIVFEAIEAELNYEPSFRPAAPSQALTANQQPPLSPDNPLALVKAAADLHYALLTAMFVTWSSQMVTIDESLLPKYTSFACQACVTSAFEKFAVIIDIYWSRLDIKHDRDELATYLPAEAIDKLEFLLRTIWTCSPCPTYMSLESLPFMFEFMSDSMLGFMPEKMPNGEGLFYPWREWFFDETSGLPAASRLEPLAAKAAAVGFTVAEHIALDRPIFSDARRTAHKTLAYHFDLDELSPMFEGKSLYQLADAYFDTASSRLANSDLVWYDSDSK